VKLLLTLLLWVAISALALLFLGSLGQVSPGNPVVAVALGIGILLVVLASFRGLARSRGPGRIEEPEDVAELDVYFVCTECGTEFRVEKIGELQVPRHCGEQMRVERRPSGSPRGTG
jgi:hypothetical protein